ncbi:MAG: hypothetical protein WBO68_13435 [Pyrinomonadaceae bacterium]
MISIYAESFRSETGSARLGLSLAGIFTASFLTFLVVFVAYDVFSSFGNRADADRLANEQQTKVVIDPKIEADLAKVLAADPAPAADDVSDAFADRGGLSAATSQAAQSQGARPGTSDQTAAAGTSGGSTSGGAAAAGTAGGTATVVDISSADAIKARYERWLSPEGDLVQTRPVAEILVIDDLVPVGFSGGGTSGEEVMLFSKALCKVFSFAPGTAFLNGYLDSFNQQEVIFKTKSGIRRKSYRRPEPCIDTGTSTASAAAVTRDD